VEGEEGELKNGEEEREKKEKIGRHDPARTRWKPTSERALLGRTCVVFLYAREH